MAFQRDFALAGCNLFISKYETNQRSFREFIFKDKLIAFDNGRSKKYFNQRCSLGNSQYNIRRYYR